MANPKIGDVVEIATNRGLAYAQVTHIVDEWGYLIRVLPGFSADRPSDFHGLVSNPSQFKVFFPLAAAVRRKIMPIVANLAVPPADARFPTFRAAGFIDLEGKVQDWWLWDGNREWRVEALDAEARAYPSREVWNDTLLIERIEQGWLPQSDQRLY